MGAWVAMESKGPASLDEEVAALSRGADRDSLFMQAGLTIPDSGETASVRVRNLSSGGMLAEGAAQVQQGAAVIVELRNIGPVAGHVVWVGDGKFGIAFDRQINPHSVRRQIVQKGDLPAYMQPPGKGPIYRQR